MNSVVTGTSTRLYVETENGIIKIRNPFDYIPTEIDLDAINKREESKNNEIIPNINENEILENINKTENNDNTEIKSDVVYKQKKGKVKAVTTLEDKSE